MTPSNLAITYSGEDSSDDSSVWVNLEQVKTSSYNWSANLTDFAAMVARARGGLSAKTYKKASDDVEVTEDSITFPLKFYVWPSDLELAYTLSATSGIGTEIDDGEQVRIERGGNVVVPMADSVDLPYLIEVVSAEWETPCYDEYSADIGAQTIDYADGQLLIGAECFGVIRLEHAALGYLHTCTVTITKPDGDQVEDISLSVFCKFTDEDGETQTTELELEIPQTILDYLELCPDGTWLSKGSVTKDKETPLVYYSTCSGNELGVYYE